MGLPYAYALDLPHGELMDLIAVDQIKTSGFTPKYQETEDDFWAVLEMR